MKAITGNSGPLLNYHYSVNLIHANQVYLPCMMYMMFVTET